MANSRDRRIIFPRSSVARVEFGTHKLDLELLSKDKLMELENLVHLELLERDSDYADFIEEFQNEGIDDPLLDGEDE